VYTDIDEAFVFENSLGITVEKDRRVVAIFLTNDNEVSRRE
jgi:hypothetical protein